jgi:hypothetical protein
MLYLVCHNEVVSLITVGVGLYQKLSRNITLLDPVVCRYLTMMLDGVLVLEVGSHHFSWHGTHVDSMLYFSRCYMLVVSKRSCYLQHRHVKDTGRELLALNLSPFLNKAVTLAYFQSLGTSPSSIVFLEN